METNEVIFFFQAMDCIERVTNALDDVEPKLEAAERAWLEVKREKDILDMIEKGTLKFFFLSSFTFSFLIFFFRRIKRSSCRFESRARRLQ